MPTLRVIAGSAAELRPEELVPLNPDIVIVRNGPRGLRWRTRSADLANRRRLVHAAGGESSLGNLVLTSLRVSVGEEWAIQYPLTPGHRMYGAVLAHCAVRGGSVLVAGSLLAEPSQASILAARLPHVDGPVILAVTGPGAGLLAEGRTPVVAGIVVSGGVDVRETRVLAGGAVLMDCVLPALVDQAPMVSEPTSH
jgi:hypothetical protein